MRRTGILENVQLLRVAAVALIVLSQARTVTPIGRHVAFDFGDGGIDILFYVSGFAIAEAGRIGDAGRPGRFLLKRAIRILPFYWATIALLFAAARIAPALAGPAGAPGRRMLAAALVFAPFFHAGGGASPAFAAAWPLARTVLFYLVFAAVLPIRAEVPRLVVASVALVLLCVGGALLHSAALAGTAPADPLMLEFMVGLWLNRLYHLHEPRRAGPLAAALLVTAIAIAAGLLAAGDLVWPGLSHPVKWGYPAFAIVAAALALQHGGRILRGRLLLLLGEASFAIALAAPAVIAAATVGYAKLGPQPRPVHVVVQLLVYAAIALGGLAAHLFVERPVIGRLRLWLLPTEPPSVAAA